MTKVREEVTIAAPAARVWSVVHEDLGNAPKWTKFLTRAVVIEEDDQYRVIRYDLALPAWKGSLEVEEEVWEPSKECAGRFVGGPLKGDWRYVYRERGGKTKLVYEMDYELGGMMRLVGGLLAGQYAAGIRETMVSLKAYVESGKGPKS